jgi:proline reductase-associated electron transfer protein PrdC
MDNLQILLRQHVGKPCAPVVKKGDKVKRGTLIAEPTGLGANIFSSADGVVEDVLEDRIIIKPDEEQSDDYVKIDEGTPLEMVKAAGVVGMGGAGFPTGIKLDTHFDGDGYILVNASECEPGLAHNIDQLNREPEKVLAGVKYAMEISGANKAIIAIKKKHHDTIVKLDKLLENEPDISRHLLPDIYPMGEERAVVRECLGIELEPSQLPSAARAVVINSETCSRIAEAIDERKPSFLKNLTVRGKLNGGNEAHVFVDVPVGTSVRDLIERAGGIDGEYGEITMGGAFTGKSTTLDAPITKTTGAILVSMPFLDLKGARVGLLVCACGGTYERMQEICKKYNGVEVSHCFCKQAQEQKNGSRKCERPGNCPGQVKNNLQFKKDKCEYIIIGNCSDCSNTVMASGPKMGLKVIHMTDHLMRAVGHPLYRTLRVSKKVDQDLNVVDNAEDNE